MARRAGIARRVLAPSDLGPRQQAGARLRVAGRVVLAAGHRCALGDCCATVEVLLRDKIELKPGEWALLEGVWRGHELGQAELVERWGSPEPRAGGEFARQSWQAVGRHLRDRSRVLAELRRYFARQGFCEVDTPLLADSPGFDAQVEGIRAQGGWLVTSPELGLKRLLVGGHSRIYQLSHAFRGDETGTWHKREFMLLEWYRAFADLEPVIRDTEQLIARAATVVCGRAELQLPDGRRLDASPPYPRLTVEQAFDRYAGVRDAHRLAAENEARYFELLVGQVEPALAAFPKPVLLWRYPISQAALARRAPDDPRVAERFELYAGGVELCNGFAELTDPAEHRRRLRHAERARRRLGRRSQPPDPRFLAAVEEGLPPSAGNALGVDRLVALVTGAPGIDLVQPLAP